MKQLLSITFILSLLLYMWGCQPAKQDTTSTTSPSPTQTTAPETSSTTTTTQIQQGSGGPPPQTPRPKDIPQNLLFIKGALSVSTEPVKVEGANDTSGKPITIYSFPDSKITAELDGETVSSPITLIDNKTMAITLQLKNSYDKYKQIQKLTLEIPEYDTIILTNLNIGRSGGSIDLEKLSFKKKTKG